MTKRSDAKLEELLAAELAPGEVVEMSVFGNAADAITGENVILALTNQRLVSITKAVVRVTTLSWKHSEVTAVGGSAGLLRSSLVFTVPGDLYTVAKVAKADAEAFRRALQAKIAAR